MDTLVEVLPRLLAVRDGAENGKGLKRAAGGRPVMGVNMAGKRSRA
jgi:hypothetical protein